MKLRTRLLISTIIGTGLELLLVGTSTYCLLGIGGEGAGYCPIVLLLPGSLILFSSGYSDLFDFLGRSFTREVVEVFIIPALLSMILLSLLIFVLWTVIAKLFVLWRHKN